MITLTAFFAKHPNLGRAALKVLAASIVAGAFAFAVSKWRDSLIDQGFHKAEAQFSTAVEEANRRAAVDQGRLDQMVIAFNGLAQNREQAITLQIKPLTERIQDAVASNLRYRDCVVDDGVLQDIQAGRAAVNAGIAASRPGAPGR